MPNKFAANCARCGIRVEAGMGVTRKGGAGEGKWVTTHAETCPTAPCDRPTQPTTTAVSYTPTAEQIDCVKWFATHGDLVIQAGAGAGKTSTLIQLANHALVAGRQGWYGAFNKSIVTDTAKKMPGNVECSTMHSLAFRAVGVAYRARLDSGRQRNDEVARILGIDPFAIPFGDGFKTMAAGWLAGKVMAAVRSFCQSADPELTARHFAYIDAVDLPDAAGNRTYDNNDALSSYLLPFARQAWVDLQDVNGRLRFSHDVYLKIWQLGSPRIDKDFILFDEAQDADPVQVSIIEQQKQYGTQVVVVGDEQQVIYEWRGAVDALARFEASGAHVCFLSQSFRFGDAVAHQANGLLGRLSARLRISGYGPAASVVGPLDTPDAILCRSNAAAIKAFRAETDAGRRAYLVGGTKDTVAFCRAAIDLQNGRHTAHPELSCFDSWTAVQTYVESDEQGEDLRLMVKIVDEFGAAEIVRSLEAQPAREEDADVVVSTAHKSKGREWDRVKINGDFKAPKGGGELSASELRLAYVAVTRAKRHLDIDAVPHFAHGWTPGPAVA